jgi:hypothetical protein
MSQYRYVLLANDGTSHDLSRRQIFNESTFDLPNLLDGGWRPVRETPLGKGPFYNPDGEELAEYSAVLILLEKD